MKMKLVLYLGIAIMFVVLFLSSCQRDISSSEKKYDSLFLGISLGMEKQAFYDYCWEMNRQKIFLHGVGNRSVQYRLSNELQDTVNMEFYPSFYEDKIYEMPVLFTYDAWAPWNKQFSADTLFIKMLPILQKWYGSFKEMDYPGMGKIYYRMDGKRRINYFIRDDQFVQLVFTDLKAEKKVKAEKENESKKEAGVDQ
jgi:hypothetical protein